MDDYRYISHLASLSVTDAFILIREVRSVLYQLDANSTYLDFLFHMGPFASQSLTSVDFWASPEIGRPLSSPKNFVVCYGLKTILKLKEDNERGYFLAVTTCMKSIAIFHYYDLLSEAMFWLVMEDDTVACKKPFQAKDSRYYRANGHPLEHSLRVNLDFCEMFTLGWAKALDTMEGSIQKQVSVVYMEDFMQT